MFPLIKTPCSETLGPIKLADSIRDAIIAQGKNHIVDVNNSHLTRKNAHVGSICWCIKSLLHTQVILHYTTHSYKMEIEWILFHGNKND